MNPNHNSPTTLTSGTKEHIFQKKKKIQILTPNKRNPDTKNQNLKK